MDGYMRTETLAKLPHLPLEGNLDITYRCNNNCRHCWLRIPPGDPEGQRELDTDERVMRDAVEALIS